MNSLTFGDFIIIQLALQGFMGGVDLASQSGLYMSEILGKVDHTLTALRAEGTRHLPVASPDGPISVKS